MNKSQANVAWIASVPAMALGLALTAPMAAQTTPAPAPKPAGTGHADDAPNGNRSIWTLDVTADRKKHATMGGYTKKWDLSDLPHYLPKQHPTGTLRIWGSNYLKDGPLGAYWADAFKKFQPGITIEYNLPTAGIAVPALAGKVADLAVGRPATLMDYLTFEQVFKYEPTEIIAATGSYDVYGWSPGFIILVNSQNPLTQISMKQLDGVFGTARNGGYDRSIWRTDYPYAAERKTISAPGTNWVSPENGPASPSIPAASRLAPTSRMSSKVWSCTAAISGSKDIAPTPTTPRLRARSTHGAPR